MSRIIAVTGKGGVGKTHLSMNLALQCASAGLRTCVFGADPDADSVSATGPADTRPLHKPAPHRTLADVLDGRCRLRDIVQSAFGIDILHGGPDMGRLADLPSAALSRLGEEFRLLDEYDVILLDSASGAADNVSVFVTAAPEILLVITPEPTALTDAYALVKSLQRQHYRGRLQVVVNQAHSERQALHTYEKFREVVRVYQGIDLPLLGAVPADARVAEAVDAQTPISILQPDSGAGLALRELAARLLRVSVPQSDAVSGPENSDQDALSAFWTRLTGQALAPVPETVTAVATAVPVESPQPAVTVETSATSAVVTARLEHLEMQLARITALLELHAVAQPARQTAAVQDLPPPRASAERSPSADDAQPAPQRRRAGETPLGGRGLRANLRATPIDALQLRRVVGRMLIKAMPAVEPDAAAGAEPVRIAVDQLQLESDNDFSLRPGRYTHISLHCAHIESPDRFIEEIFANCAITGCKVRNLGSHVRYWVTSGRDGCILLDGAVGERNCVQVYMAAGGNSPLEAVGSEAETAVPRLRRISRADEPAATARELLGKFPHERLDGEGGDVLYRLSRRDREPLLCAFHHAGGDDDASGGRRERSPLTARRLSRAEATETL
ncbi:MAG TPA: AAA family ATPase [Gammaproteobacteria bacterium]